MNTLRILRLWTTSLLAIASLALPATSHGFTVDANGAAITGLWYNAAEPGWGANFVQQYDVIFVTMFVYDAAGNPTWYVASDCAVSGSGCSGALYKTAAGQPPTTTWNGPITSAAVGTVTLSFFDLNSGSMNYAINGVNGSKAITRQVWRTGPSANPAPTAPLDFSTLNGNKTNKLVTFYVAACPATGAQATLIPIYMNVAVATSGTSATMTLFSAGQYLTFNLQYQSGNSTSGFDLSGSGTEMLSTAAFAVSVGSLLNTNKNTNPAYSNLYDLSGAFYETFANGCRVTGAF